MSDSDKRSTPSWQKRTPDEATAIPHASDPATQLSHAELIEQARDFLKEESIRGAPHDRKVAFLKEKGLSTDDISQLLDSDASAATGEHGLKTVHDSTTDTQKDIEPRVAAQPSSPSKPTSVIESTKRDVPPIITYPEFLLKPQKPPPLVTFQRLAYAAYALAGASALTYAASKYIVEPMLEALTESRHDLAHTTLQDLEKLNNKLETSVSHVPYIANSATQKALHKDDEDTTSVDSDPTELFHRDIATQTSPKLSRSSSSSSLNKQNTFNATEHQTTSLTSLHSTLESLVSSLDPSNEPFTPPQASKQLQETVTQFQAVLDKIENTYNPFRSDYSNVYSSLPDPKKANSKNENNEASKFKAEIRALKGAFLSSRNFPTARPVPVGGRMPGAR